MFKESKFAHQWLDRLDAEQPGGIEIGASAHNPFGMKNCTYVDYTKSLDTKFKKAELEIVGRTQHVDVEAYGDDLPFSTSSFNYLINCHVIEHQPNVIKSLIEWWRVIQGNGIIYCVVPLYGTIPEDRDRLPTEVESMINDFILDHNADTKPIHPSSYKCGHYNVFTRDSFDKLIHTINRIWFYQLGFEPFDLVDGLDICDKVANGFVRVIRVNKQYGDQLPWFGKSS